MGNTRRPAALAHQAIYTKPLNTDPNSIYTIEGQRQSNIDDSFAIEPRVSSNNATNTTSGSRGRSRLRSGNAYIEYRDGSANKGTTTPMSNRDRRKRDREVAELEYDLANTNPQDVENYQSKLNKTTNDALEHQYNVQGRGGLNSPEEYSNRKNYETYKYDYYSGSQAKVFFGDIWVDDIVTIQYNIRQSKEPIYGYASQYYDAIAMGTVLGEGMLVVAFKETGYLNVIQAFLEEQARGAYRATYNASNRLNNTLAGNGNIGEGQTYTTSQYARQVSPNYNPSLIRQSQSIEEAMDAVKGASDADMLGTPYNSTFREGRIEQGAVTNSNPYGNNNVDFIGTGGNIKDFEDAAEILEDVIWGDNNGKQMILPEKAHGLKRADEFDYKYDKNRNPIGINVPRDGYEDAFNIIITYGDMTDQRGEHTLQALNDVHFTGQSIQVSPTGEPIAEVYNFIFRDLNKTVNNSAFKINQIALNIGPNESFEVSKREMIANTLNPYKALYIEIIIKSVFDANQWNIRDIKINPVNDLGMPRFDIDENLGLHQSLFKYIEDALFNYLTTGGNDRNDFGTANRLAITINTLTGNKTGATPEQLQAAIKSAEGYITGAGGTGEDRPGRSAQQYINNSNVPGASIDNLNIIAEQQAGYVYKIIAPGNNDYTALDIVRREDFFKPMPSDRLYEADPSAVGIPVLDMAGTGETAPVIPTNTSGVLNTEQLLQQKAQQELYAAAALSVANPNTSGVIYPSGVVSEASWYEKVLMPEFKTHEYGDWSELTAYGNTYGKTSAYYKDWLNTLMNRDGIPETFDINTLPFLETDTELNAKWAELYSYAETYGSNNETYKQMERDLIAASNVTYEPAELTPGQLALQAAEKYGNMYNTHNVTYNQMLSDANAIIARENEVIAQQQADRVLMEQARANSGEASGSIYTEPYEVEIRKEEFSIIGPKLADVIQYLPEDKQEQYYNQLGELMITNEIEANVFNNAAATELIETITTEIIKQGAINNLEDSGITYERNEGLLQIEAAERASVEYTAMAQQLVSVINALPEDQREPYFNRLGVTMQTNATTPTTDNNATTEQLTTDATTAVIIQGAIDNREDGAMASEAVYREEVIIQGATNNLEDGAIVSEAIYREEILTQGAIDNREDGGMDNPVVQQTVNGITRVAYTIDETTPTRNPEDELNTLFGVNYSEGLTELERTVTETITSVIIQNQSVPHLTQYDNVHAEGDTIPNQVIDLSEKYDDIQYHMRKQGDDSGLSGKDPTQGKLDCSGYVCTINNKLAESNPEQYSYIDPHTTNTTKLSTMGREVSRDNLPATGIIVWKPGDINPNTGRASQYGHTGQFFTVNGELYVTHSEGGQGVVTEKYSDSPFRGGNGTFRDLSKEVDNTNGIPYTPWFEYGI